MGNVHQANGSSNGWLFEYAAGLFLFLSFIGNVKQIGLEKDEDIVLIKNDNKKVVAQAKSTLSVHDIYHTGQYNNLYNSLNTLSSQNNPDVDELIMINNFRKPFGEDTEINLQQENEHKLKFDDFPEKAKEKLKKIADDNKLNIDFDKVYNWFLKFESEKPQSYIKSVLESKLVKLGDKPFASSEIILNKWKEALENNSREKEKFIETNTLTGILFSVLLYGSLTLEDVKKYSGLDIEVDEIGCEDEINKFFNESSLTLDIYNDIVSSFISYSESNSLTKSREALKNFINSINDVPLYFSTYFDNTIYDKLKLYRIFVTYVIIKNKTIDQIKGVFGYENK